MHPRPTLSLRSPLQTPGCASRAFSLVELLTVIAIIGIIAAILIPTVGRVRLNARASQCVANLRTWHNATSLYVAENKGRLPVSAYIQGATVDGVYFSGLAQDAYFHINRYVVGPNHPCAKWGYNQNDLSAFICPTRDDAGNNLTWGAYAFNGYASTLMLSSISDPARLVWATEAAGGGGGQRWLQPEAFNANSTSLLGTTSKPHGLKNNMLYLDGRVSAQVVGGMVRADFTRGTPAYNAAHENARLAN